MLQHKLKTINVSEKLNTKKLNLIKCSDNTLNLFLRQIDEFLPSYSMAFILDEKRSNWNKFKNRIQHTFKRFKALHKRNTKN